MVVDGAVLGREVEEVESTLVGTHIALVEHVEAHHLAGDGAGARVHVLGIDNDVVSTARLEK